MRMGASRAIDADASQDQTLTFAIVEALRARARVIAPLLLVSITGLTLLFLATPYGLGVSPDSTQYLSAAEHLLRGDGLRVHWWDEGAQPFTHFPPGFALSLSFLTGLGLTADTSARLINGMALLISAFLAYALTRKASGSVTAGLFGAAAVVLARDFLAAHAMIWSEPVFLALMLGALLATTRAVESGRMAPVFVGAVLVGIAGLTRYVAPAVMGACALALLAAGTTSLRTRIQRSFAFGVVAALPLAALMVFNASRAGAATNRQLAFHPPGGAEFKSAVGTAYYWVMPLQMPLWVRFVVFVAVGWGWVFFVRSIMRSRGAGLQVPAEARYTRTVLALCCGCYLAFLLLSLTLFDAQSTPDRRLLLPVVPVLTILVVAGLSDAIRVPARRRASIALGAVLSIALVVSAAQWIVGSRRDGLGYSAPVWKQSALIAAVRSMGPNTTIFSNAPGAILFHTGREVLGIPRLANPNTLQRYAQFDERMAIVCKQSESRTIAYVHFTVEDSEWFLPTLADVRQRWRTVPRLVAPEGVLEVVPAGCAPHGTEPPGQNGRF